MPRRLNIPSQPQVEREILTRFKVILYIQSVIILCPARIVRGHLQLLLIRLTNQETGKRVAGLGVIRILAWGSKRSFVIGECVVRRSRARGLNRILVRPPIEPKAEGVLSLGPGNAVGYHQRIGDLQSLVVIAPIAVAGSILSGSKIELRERSAAGARDAENRLPVRSVHTDRISGGVDTVKPNRQVVEDGRAGDIVPPETEVVSVVIVVVVIGREWRRQIKVITVEEVLLAAVVGEEQLILFCDIFIDSEASLRGHDMIKRAGIEIVLHCPGNPIAVCYSRKIRLRHIGQYFLGYGARSRDLVAREGQAAGLPPDHLRGGRIKDLSDKNVLPGRAGVGNAGIGPQQRREVASL